ncbi:MAG TPA: hypothetical protein DCM08_09775 [Microscillaceae bacterium]|nr:hypothetical protein [Microscillaceae bacterium]
MKASDNTFDVMGFLNEAALRFPDAISFASGRPITQYIPTAQYQHFIQDFVSNYAKRHHLEEATVLQQLGQYNKTAGFILPEASQYLAQSRFLEIPPELLMLCVGNQEAMLISLLALFSKVSEGVLVVDQYCYTGILDAARWLNIEVAWVSQPRFQFDLETLRATVKALQQQGKKPLLYYCNPDFQNPLGYCLSEGQRQDLAAWAAEEGMYIFEDFVYADFWHKTPPPPPIKRFDTQNKVIFAESFSKSVFPGMRLGLLASPPSLIERLVHVKAYTTVNTPTLEQCFLAGLWLKEGFTLARHVQPARTALALQRQAMLEALQTYLPGGDFRWTSPEGGFFLLLHLPFALQPAEVQKAAAEFGVIFCPLSFFSADGSGAHVLRLAYSLQPPEQIWLGIERLAHFLHRMDASI